MSEGVAQFPPTSLAPEQPSQGTERTQAFLKTYGRTDQQPAEIAVIMPSIWRASLRQALRSAIEQDFDGHVQILLGFDTPNDSRLDLDQLIGVLPANRSVLAFYPGYSTSARHGGLHPAFDGGALRIVLCYLANARALAFLDDDNWWAPQHLRFLYHAMQGAQWAFSLRWFVHPVTAAVLCVDEWESVGPGRGVWVPSYGGFVDPNCLMFDKLACDAAIRWWGIPLVGDREAMSADRQVFRELAHGFTCHSVDQPTVYYRISSTDPVHGARTPFLQQRGVLLDF